MFANKDDQSIFPEGFNNDVLRIVFRPIRSCHFLFHKKKEKNEVLLLIGFS